MVTSILPEIDILPHIGPFPAIRFPAFPPHGKPPQSDSDCNGSDILVNGRCVKTGALGNDCHYDTDCWGNNVCLPDSKGRRVCTKGGGLGEGCHYDSDCFGDNICVGNKCVSHGPISSQCNKDSDCFGDSICDKITGLCAKPIGGGIPPSLYGVGSPGGDCSRDGDCPGNNICQPIFKRCVWHNGEIGSDCFKDGHCNGNLVCRNLNNPTANCKYGDCQCNQPIGSTEYQPPLASSYKTTRF